MQNERVKELIEAADVFKRVLAINHPWDHEMYDDQYLSRYIPGVWPRWGEFRRLLHAISAFSSPAEIRKGARPPFVGIDCDEEEYTPNPNHGGLYYRQSEANALFSTLEARIAELEALLAPPDRSQI